ncbi:uncharacterized protein LOC131958394 [Physella acuta]|uniref:uncharacterized protein LOC131958394 n=1 Tax=Physella acuta TaxID=109671 RepID=UPI0027DD7087|nr:uncharacterized protein LOC131958394 [Physella acuta]
MHLSFKVFGPEKLWQWLMLIILNFTAVSCQVVTAGSYSTVSKCTEGLIANEDRFIFTGSALLNGTDANEWPRILTFEIKPDGGSYSADAFYEDARCSTKSEDNNLGKSNRAGCRTSFDWLLSAKIEFTNNKFISTLLMYNVRQGPNAYYACSIDFQRYVNVCNPLEFYSKPEGLQCNEPRNVNDKNEIYIFCSISKVYPSAKMSLKFLQFEKIVACVNETNSTGVITCQDYISVVNLKPGINFIDMLVYPNVSGGEKYGVKQRLNKTLTFPQASLSADCLQILNVTKGYVKQGDVANCTCYIKTQGDPPGSLQWYYSNGTAIQNIKLSDTATLQVRFNDSNTNKSYTCTAYSALGTDDGGLDFTVQNSYGPDYVALFTTDSSSVYDACTGSINVNFMCSIFKQSVAPEPTVSISLLNGEMLVLNTNHNSTHYIYKSSYKPKSSGYFTFRCKAMNSIFNELENVGTATIFIAGPPSKPPNIILGKSQLIESGGTIGPIKEGSSLEIMCQVEGGFPNSYTMTVSCTESYSNSTINNSGVSLLLRKVSRTFNGIRCTCKALHVTSCFTNNTSSANLNITYQAVIQQFTANSNTDNLTVSNNTQVTFSCIVDSNPPPIVQILRELTVHNLTKRMYCEDSGEYICKAHNTEFIQADQRSLIVYILCKPLLLKS